MLRKFETRYHTLEYSTMLRWLSGQNEFIGFTGFKGVIGWTGPQGWTGSTCGTGFSGPKGAIGEPREVKLTGSPSEIGFQGSVGQVGQPKARGTPEGPGQTGNTGFNGQIGAIGQQGQPGDTGSPGPRGLLGLQGATMVLPDHAVPRVNLVSRAPSDSLVMLASPETLDLLDRKNLRATLANRVSSSVITAGLEPAGSKSYFTSRVSSFFFR